MDPLSSGDEVFLPEFGRITARVGEVRSGGMETVYQLLPQPQAVYTRPAAYPSPWRRSEASNCPTTPRCSAARCCVSGRTTGDTGRVPSPRATSGGRPPPARPVREWR